MRIVIVALMLLVLPLRMVAADVPVTDDVAMGFLVKMLAEAPLAASLLGVTYLLRPVLKTYLDKQIEQLKLIAESLDTFGQRIDRVEQKVDGLVKAEAHHA